MSFNGSNSVFKSVDVHAKRNNSEHHNGELPEDQLTVRRGQAFKVTLNLAKAFKHGHDSLVLIASTGGEHASEEKGTSCRFGIPDAVNRRASAKAPWQAELDAGSSPSRPVLLITAPADAPVGRYTLKASLWGEDKIVATLVLLFNPWFSGDSVFLPNEQERREYVLNEQGVIYQGSSDYIAPLSWDFGHFEDDMVDICLLILDKSLKYREDPSSDLASRSDPVYVGRVVSAMINSQDDGGVVMGNWSDFYDDGMSPLHWSGSHAILSKWKKSNCLSVKYGQCWVFAGVMCSVMRLLGIPTRVITNFVSAHDTDGSLTIDVYHAETEANHKESMDSIWNYHVWVESWMKRPDLKADGKYDGWQVLDATPQEPSKGLYRCGPASLVAILNGETDLEYDVPFVFAEVNADCIDWLIKDDGTEVVLNSDTKRVGKRISTKAVGEDRWLNITGSYKHKEGSEMERNVFKYAISDDKEDNDDDSAGGVPDTWRPPAPPPQLTMRFDEVSVPEYGKDVQLRLVLSSESRVERKLGIRVNVEGMRYNGTFVVTIQSEVKEETLQPLRELSVPIVIPVRTYYSHMHRADSLKVSALVTDKKHPDEMYLAEDDVVLRDPPVIVTVSSYIRQHQWASGEVVFMNPIQETLTGMTLTLSGSGLLRDELEYRLPDLSPNSRIRVKFEFLPYRTGLKTLVADIHATVFKDFKGRCAVNVRL
ncbi:LOW QUALITY PROTEIN: protein-glutamine gamma-glutamyltransferase E [Phyllopteryx taeniolatus]|uniref:LOW QUALITY PROTEIN: protein-glutamine gamma-glutamyltransferase E n=1 Tax=Phyllopteryx taeniolatus TaxID=161469 RepID=UPI002AD22EFA|nr:LOW QUALITY PROTEIN: protein-glutamine gamma-glutamyltransferase E [Phyllopteryx taeniolatus]